MERKLDLTNLPTKMETKEDYELICENFVLPFFYEQTEKIVEIIKELHTLIEEDNVEQEEVELHVNRIRDLASFANEDSPMAPYFENLVALEEKLYNEGAFTDDTESSSD